MNNNPIKYVMFDFDGTIIDSMPFLENNAVFLLMKYFNFSETKARKYYQETTGLPFIQQMELISSNNSLNDQIVKEFEKLKLDHIYDQTFFSESLEVLQDLISRGYNLGISSGTYQSIITSFLEKKNVNFFNDILGWRPCFEKGKDHFNYVLTKYNLKSSEIVFIGDSLDDAKKAKLHDVDFIGKEGMFGTAVFQKIIPNVKIIASFDEILHYLPSQR